MVVYVDLDGTLADHKSQFLENFTNKDFWILANKEGFFENLPLLPWAKQLMAYLEDLGVEVRILTATGHQNGRVANEKIRWVRKHFSHIPKSKIITVTSGIDKHLYAEKGDILIDDTLSVLELWEAHGGTPILIGHEVIGHLAEKIDC